MINTIIPCVCGVFWGRHRIGIGWAWSTPWTGTRPAVIVRKNKDVGQAFIYSIGRLRAGWFWMTEEA